MKKTLLLLSCIFSLSYFAQTSCYSGGSYYQHLGSGFSDPNFSSPAVAVKEIVNTGNYVVVVGKFRNAYGDTAKNISLYEKNTRRWYRLADEPNGEVKAAVIDQNKLYIVGTFTKIGATSFDKLAAYDFTTQQWSSVTTAAFPSLSPSNAEVKSIAVLNGDIYFSTSANSSGNYITYKATATAITNYITTNAEVKKIKKNLDSLYLVGAFTTIKLTSQPSAQNIKSIAKYHNGSISQLGASGVPITYGSNNTTISCIDVYNNIIYVGGTFSQYNGQNYYGILMYNGAAWDTATTRFSSSTSNAAVSAISVASTGIFVGSTSSADLYFWDNTLNQQVNAKKIARYNSGKWATINNPTTASSFSIIGMTADAKNGDIYVLQTTDALLIESKKSNIADRLYHGIKPSFSNAAENFRQVRPINDKIYFNYSQSFNAKLAKFNLQTGLIDTAFKIPSIASHTNVIPAAIGHKNNQSLLAVFQAKTISGNNYFNFLFEYNETTNTFTQIGSGIPSSSSNKDAWGCGFIRGKYFVLAEDLYEFDGTNWINKTFSGNPLVYTSFTYQLYNAFDVSSIDSSLYFTNLQSLYKYDGTNATVIHGFGSGNKIRSVHVANDGDVYFGGDFGGTYSGAGGINNIAYYSQDSAKAKPLGGGINVDNYGTYLRDITSIGDSIFITGELETNYNQPSVANNTSGDDVQIWDKGLKQWVCFDSRLSENQNIEAYKGGLIGTTNTTIAKNGTSNIPAITSESWWMWNLGTSSSLPVFVADSGLGVNTLSLPKTLFFDVYPNPANDYIVVIQKDNSRDSKKLQITNLMGQVVLTQTISDQSKQIKTDYLTPGVYLIMVESKEKRGVQRLIIQ
ncbi:MAG: T9SS type A sorting domain-containing protein [Bacteroidetes bacterium]|nr:T9SS type A sorting domain-containing protein [Bacteroidota bacterium]